MDSQPSVIIRRCANVLATSLCITVYGGIVMMTVLFSVL